MYEIEKNYKSFYQNSINYIKIYEDTKKDIYDLEKYFVTELYFQLRSFIEIIIYEKKIIIENKNKKNEFIDVEDIYAEFLQIFISNVGGKSKTDSKTNINSNNVENNSYYNLYVKLKKILYINGELREQNDFNRYIFKIGNNIFKKYMFNNPLTKKIYCYYIKIYKKLEITYVEERDIPKLDDVIKWEKKLSDYIYPNISYYREKYVKPPNQKNKSSDIRIIIKDGVNGLKKLIIEIIELLEVFPKISHLFNLLDKYIIMTDITFERITEPISKPIEDTTSNPDEDITSDSIAPRTFELEENSTLNPDEDTTSNLDETTTSNLDDDTSSDIIDDTSLDIFNNDYCKEFNIYIRKFFQSDPLMLFNKKVSQKYIKIFYIYLENSISSKISVNKEKELGSFSALSEKILNISDAVSDYHKNSIIKCLGFIFKEFKDEFLIDYDVIQKYTSEFLEDIQNYMYENYDYISEIRKKIDDYSEN